MPRVPDEFGLPIEQLLRPIRQVPEPYQLDLPLEPPSDYWGITSKDLLPKKSLTLDEHLAAIEKVARGGSLGSTERIPKVAEVTGIIPRGPRGLTPGVLPDPSELPLHLQELEKVPHELDPGVLQEPSFLLNQPLTRTLGEANQLAREPRQDARLNKVLAHITDLFARSGLPEEELVAATDSLERLGSRVKAPLEGASEVETGLSMQNALEVLKDVRNRLNPSKGLRRAIDDPEEEANLARLQGGRDPQQGAREAAELLNLVSAVRSGGDIGDFTGETRSGGILRSNSFAERQEKGKQIRGIVGRRQGPAPSDRRNSQFQLNPVRQPLQYENIPDPDAVRGIRPEVSDDPFENVLSGQSRSVLKDADEVQRLGLAPGKTIALQSGDGRIVKATVVALRNADPNDAAEMGLRTGYTPKSVAELVRQKLEKSRKPQVEVVFKPQGATRPGLEDEAVSGPLTKLGTESAREARAGVGTANPRIDLGLSEAQLQDLASKGYTKFRDELSYPKTKQKGAPFAIQKDDGKEWLEVFPGAEGTPARYGRVLNEAKFKNQVRQKTLGELRMQHRDQAQLGAGPSTEATARTISGRPDDRRDLEFRPTSVGKEVTDPKEAINILRGKEVPKGTFIVAEHWDPKYTGRTYFNAQNSDATLLIGANLSSRGSAQTAQAAKEKLVPVESFQDFLQGKDSAVMNIVARLNKVVKGSKERKGIILNIAGNRANVLGKAGKFTQAQINEKMLQLIEKIANHPGRGFEIQGIVTGGQTGIDEAGAMAGRKLGIPTAVVLPKNYQLNEAVSGVDVWPGASPEARRAMTKRRFTEGEDVSEELKALGAESAVRLAARKKNNPR